MNEEFNKQQGVYVNNTKPSKRVGLGKEAGVAGYKIASGYVYDEFLHELQGTQGRRKYREMSDNDPIVGAILSAINYILRAVDWHVDANSQTEDEEAAQMVEDALMKMPDMAWDDAISEALSMLVFGFSILEMVFYRCPETGYYKPKKLAPRSQETIWEWDADDNGNIAGMWQMPPMSYRGNYDLYIPENKVLHFRTDYNRGNPEGRSLLRNAYRSYHFVKNISMIEAIAIERELNGLPVLYIPSEVFEDASKVAEYTKIVRDVKFNEQGGIVLPSETYTDDEGKPTSNKMYELKLLASEGSRNIDTSGVIRRHQTDMARTILADFVMLGDGKGSYALSSDKTDLFLQAIKSILGVIEAEINRKLIPTMWKVNGLDEKTMPTLRHGKVVPEDLSVLGSFVRDLASAGIMLNDEETENHLRDVAGLPEAEKDDLVGNENP